MKFIRSLSSTFLSILLILWVILPVALAKASDSSGEYGLLTPYTSTSNSMDISSTTPSGIVTSPTPIESSTPTAIVLTNFDEPGRTDAVAFALGAPEGDLLDWFADYFGGFTGYDSEGNFYDLMTGTWSIENVNTTIPGLYYASATPDLDDGFVLGEGVPLPKQLCAVSIQTPGQPDINCCVSARGFLRFPWMLSSLQQEQLEQFTVWLRQDCGEWTQLSEGSWFTSDYLQLSQRIFENGSSYELRVIYPGGQTGVLTFRYDGELTIIDYTGGDRDGGDVSGSSPTTGLQPAPTIPQPQSPSYDNDAESTQNVTPIPASAETPSESLQEPTSAPLETPSESVLIVPVVLPKQNPVSEKAESPAPGTKSDHSALATQDKRASQIQYSTITMKQSQNNTSTTQTEAGRLMQDAAPTVQEFYSPTQTIISGLRLRDLCEGEKSVVFGEGDLTVSFPSELLLALNLRATDTLSVKLIQLHDNQVTLEVRTYASTVTELSGTILRLRYKPQLQNAEITISNKAGEKIVNTEFDGEFLRFSVDTSGTYTISETAAVPQTFKAIEEAQAGEDSYVVDKSQTPEESRASHGSPMPLIPLAGCGLLLGAGGTVFIRRKLHG